MADAHVVYIGKAGGTGSPVSLRQRLSAYLRFGAGQKAAHWGGRYLWHLPDSEKLIACWKTTPGKLPRDVEKRMISEFGTVFGAMPFANLVG